MRTPLKLTCLVVAVGVVVGAPAAAAPGVDYPYKLVAADRAAARAALPRASDVGVSKWTSIAIPAGVRDLRPSRLETCKTINQTTGLTVTGYARNGLAALAGGAHFGAEIVVFQTSAMNALDWRRTDAQPAYPGCYEADVLRGVNTQQAYLSSAQTIPFPHVGTHTLAIREVFVQRASRAHLFVQDSVMMRFGRMRVLFINSIAVLANQIEKFGPVITAFDTRALKAIRTRMK